MFLLIQKTGSATITATYLFTFHDVSINTGRAKFYPAKFLSLHSTMFLLILPPGVPSVQIRRALHSTMFLLIHHTASDRGYIPVFTFHDVSIHTEYDIHSIQW